MNYRDTDPDDREMMAQERYDRAMDRHDAEEARADDARLAIDTPQSSLDSSLSRMSQAAEDLGYAKGYKAGFEHAQRLFEAMTKVLK
jgi:hypothetical protein